MSINSLYYANRGHGKTIKAQDWSHNIFHMLNNSDDLQKFTDLREFFKPNEHYYKVEFIFSNNKILTKSGQLSSGAADLSNIEKPIIDLMFLPKYFDVSSPYGLKNLNIDDKYIGELSSRKKPGTDQKIDIVISIYSLSSMT